MESFKYESFIEEFKKSINNDLNHIALEYINIENKNYNQNNKITFNNLNIISNYLSIYLKNNIINYNHNNNSTVISVYQNHSFQLIISILSIWKLNLIYLPLDISYPIDRLSFMLNDSNCNIILTNHQYHQKCINQFKNKEILCLDCLFNNKNQKEKIEINKEIEINFNDLNNLNNLNNLINKYDYLNNLNEIEKIKNQSNDPAYLIYTSGSTGNPKGVLVSHIGIVNFLKHQIKMFKFKRSHTRLLQSLPICFDASLSEIGTSLLGHCTLLIPKTTQDAQIIRGSSQSFLNHIQLNKINAAMISPSFLSLLSTEPFDSSVNKSTLETIVIGGETCPIKVLKKWRKRLNIINVYGPTETTVCTTTLPIYLKSNELNNDNSDDKDDYLSLGEIVPNMFIYLLNEDTNEPIEEIGGEGEIYIGGIGVALEYWNNIEQTKKSFINNPFLNDGSKMFKTGDWGRIIGYNKDTKLPLIEFRGRMDNQIKLNGSRIELEEISKTLENHPLIHQSIVDVKLINDKKILIGYIILKDKPLSCKLNDNDNNNNNDSINLLNSYYNSPQLLSNQFKEFLLKSLPSYMIPNHFIIMNSFPQNKNEKIDKSKLPIPSINLTDNSSNENVDSIIYIPNDENSIKNVLLKVIRQILVNENIESSDDLISNHSMTSISCTQIIEKCRTNHGIILTVFHIYILRTIDKITLNLINNQNHNINNDDINKKSIKELKLFLNNFNLTQIVQKNQILYNNKNNIKNNNENYNNNQINNNSNNILILGVTGFLGSNIFKSLFNDNRFQNFNYYLLVRDLKKGEKLILNENIENKSRIKLIEGNIGEFQLGLNKSDWDLIINCSFSTIIHSAANVNMNLPFDEMIKDNIKSTYNIIDFINQIKNKNHLKEIHYISTLSTILSNSKFWENENTFATIQDLNEPINNQNENENENNIIYGGYAQSKWLSEFIFSNSNLIDKNKLFIHRPAMICPNLLSSQDSKNNYFYLNYLNKLILTCNQIKSYPIGIPNYIETDITPINNFTENFINNIHQNGNNQKEIKYYSYYTPNSISLNSLFKSQLDQNFEGIPINDWIKKLNENHSFYPFISFLNNFNLLERILFPGQKLPKENHHTNKNYKL